MKKKKNWFKYTSLMVGIVLVFSLMAFLYFGFKEDGFLKQETKNIIINENGGGNAGTTVDLLDNCVEVCQSENFETGNSLSEEIGTTCNEKTKIEYGYANEIPLLVCCCYDLADGNGNDELVLGCNDADFTQTDFDSSILTSTHCIDDLGTHLDACDGNLLQEWSCPVVGDTCSNTFINCESFLSESIVGCKDGACVVFCEDSDNTGDSIEATESSFKTFGNCQSNGVGYLDECSGSTLTEYYCSGNYNADGSIISTSCAVTYKDCSDFGEDWGCMQGKCRLI